AENYMLSMQRQFGPNTMLSVSYVGTQGHRLLADRESNPGNPALCLALSQTSAVAPNTATCGPFAEYGTYTLPNGQIINSTRTVFQNGLGSNGGFITM